MSGASANTVAWDAVWTSTASGSHNSASEQNVKHQSTFIGPSLLGVEVVLRLKITLQILDVVPPRWILSHAAGGHHERDQRNRQGTPHRAEP